MTAPHLPALDYDRWVDSRDTLHLFLQIIGKVRLETHPKLNHWWHVTLYPHVNGLTTGRIPHTSGAFDILYDMIAHRVVVSRNDGRSEAFDPAGLSVAGFYSALFGALNSLEITVDIHAVPYDNKSKVPFPEDDAPRAYDKAAITRYWTALCWIADVFEAFRGRFTGKQTPVQLYWHSFDLVVTRFSGRAHPLEGGTQSDREAYSHEVISVGFWPGDDSFPHAAFYGYAYPEPAGMAELALEPEAAAWAEKNGGALAILRYADLIEEADPHAALLAFVQSLYDGAAGLADWPVKELEHAYAD